MSAFPMGHLTQEILSTTESSSASHIYQVLEAGYDWDHIYILSQILQMENEAIDIS